jgi:UDP-N-acetylglucosamine--N-acetylmuramyl-(pentapeptide) pyrophosphoryl-undecaprenol N-acetylglucosamine transferase
LGLIDAFQVIRSFVPDVIFSGGGYVSLPVVIIGRLYGKKVLIHEQTLSAGLANRISSFFAHEIFLTFSESVKFFNSKKVTLTGNIIRKEIFDRSKPDDLSLLELLKGLVKLEKK